ncbi:protein rhsC [Escherichia coli O104:H4 str. 11-3677]|nr:protein rhsC [Escherichia coli O104:H4 str. 11-3677]
MQSRWSKVAIFTTRWAAGWQNGYGGRERDLTGWMSAVTETASDLVRLGRRPADHDTERQEPHPDDLSAGELHATHQG